jgi:hypothetical protein
MNQDIRWKQRFENYRLALATLQRAAALALLTELDDLLLSWMIDLSIFDTLDHPALREHIERGGVVFYQKASVTRGPLDHAIQQTR